MAHCISRDSGANLVQTSKGQPLPEWLTEAEVADWLRVNRRTLARRRMAGMPPGDLARLGPDDRQWLYRRDQVEAWLEERRFQTPDQGDLDIDR